MQIKKLQTTMSCGIWTHFILNKKLSSWDWQVIHAGPCPPGPLHSLFAEWVIPKGHQGKLENPGISKSEYPPLDAQESSGICDETMACTGKQIKQLPTRWTRKPDSFWITLASMMPWFSGNFRQQHNLRLGKHALASVKGTTWVALPQNGNMEFNES